MSDEIKKFVDDELTRIKKERRAAIRKKRKRTTKIWTGVWKHVNWSRK